MTEISQPRLAFFASRPTWTAAESEVRRLSRMVSDRVVDQQVLTESERQLQSNQAGLAKARARRQDRGGKASRGDGQPWQEQGRCPGRPGSSGRRGGRRPARDCPCRLYQDHCLDDGIVVVRNVNRGDFVLTISETSAPVARSAVRSGGPAPLYVIARTDIVRIYVDVPEIDSRYVVPDTKATVRVQALDDIEFSSGVTRTSWALNVKSRTLRAEIDLPNPNARLVPGMSAYGNVLIERPKARVLPRSAIVEQGDQQVCFLHQNGKVARTPVQFGISDGTWVEMLKKRVIDAWAEFDGLEQVVLGDLIYLSDGQLVHVESDHLTQGPKDSPKVDFPVSIPPRSRQRNSASSKSLST